jgi:hypothetical protein
MAFIDRVADRVAHPLVLHDRVAHVETEIGEIEPRIPGDRERALRFELVHHVRRQIVHDQVDRALAQLEPAHRVVGHHLQHDAGVVRQPVEIAFEGGERDGVVLRADEAIRPGADGERAHRIARAVRHDRRHAGELGGKGAERLFERELHGVVVERADRLQDAKRAFERRYVRGIEERGVSVDDVLRRHRTPVVELHAAPQVRDVGQRIGVVEPCREARDHAQVLADVHQAAEDELSDALRRLVVRLPWIEVVGRRADRHHDDVAIALGRAGAAGQ